MPIKPKNNHLEILDNLQDFEKENLAALAKIKSLKDFDQLKLQILSKNSTISIATAAISQLQETAKKEVGITINKIKNNLKEKMAEKENELKQGLGSNLNKSTIDLTLPGASFDLGSLHPITQVKEKVIKIFEKMGFQLLESRLLDDYFHVFESLNFPPDHPAIDIMDTFWTADDLIPIPHTSSMQNRALTQLPLPLAAVMFGRCMRFEATDQRHEHTFNQLEGIYIDKNIRVSDLIGTLKAFLDSFFEKDIKIKIQPSFFPFVEPALEIMAECIFCHGDGCKTCSNSGWLELIPCGMVHPNVLTKAGVDPKEHNGFAWAIGIDRLAMLLYGISDIRLFHSGDLRFLRQF